MDIEDRENREPIKDNEGNYVFIDKNGNYTERFPE